MTSNEHYGILNDRFEGRSLRLRNAGFKYTHIPGYDMAAFLKPRLSKNIPICIPVSFVMHADDRCWADKLAEVEVAF